MQQATTRRGLRRLMIFAFVGAALALTRCGELPDLEQSRYDRLWNDVLNRCGACHGAGTSGTDGGPDMTTQDLFHSESVGKTGNDYPDWRTFHTNRPECADIPFIDPGNAANSLVVAVLDDSVAAGLDPCVVKDHTEPPENIAVTAGTLSELEAWIDDGAPR